MFDSVLVLEFDPTVFVWAYKLDHPDQVLMVLGDAMSESLARVAFGTAEVLLIEGSECCFADGHVAVIAFVGVINVQYLVCVSALELHRYVLLGRQALPTKLHVQFYESCFL